MGVRAGTRLSPPCSGLGYKCNPALAPRFKAAAALIASAVKVVR